jgi:hypothetical protein
LTENQRVYAGGLTAEDEALPTELFRPAEANALHVLDARREAGDDIFVEEELAHVQWDRERAMDPRGFATRHGFPMSAVGGPSEQKRRREARLLEERMADAADVPGVAWEDTRAAGDADTQSAQARGDPAKAP